MIQIAVVEDEEIYVKQLTEYIRKYQTERGRSIKVTVFGDGEDITENYSGGFDIILMDIQMPRLNGYEATRQIRQLKRADVKTLPIIAMTANAFDEDVRLALQAGMNAHFAKPIDIQRLAEILLQFLTKSHRQGND